MAVDLDRDLLFVPTGNPSPDYFRGESNLDYYGSSIVALRLSTGEIVWHFQTVHRDLWDFDVPAQPTLFEFRRDGKRIPAVVQATKMGLLFILNRETGEPLFEIEERPVPQSPVPGERLSPTQPYPVKPPPLVRHSLEPDAAWGVTPLDRSSCRKQLDALRYDGAYTPPSVEGSLMLPGNAGGSNWGGVAVDEEHQRLIANVQDFPWAIVLVAREDTDPNASLEPKEYAENAPMRGTPYGLRRWRVSSPLGIPCTSPPWGELASVDLAAGEIEWKVPLGTIRDVAPIPLPVEFGIPNLGGPLLTRAGLVFIGAALENTFRAFDAESGEQLWSTRLTYGPQATPMTYRAGGRQFVVIAATGYDRGGLPAGDAIMAFALPSD
jgi:quinoprotein glucose dehydrogenase